MNLTVICNEFSDVMIPPPLSAFLCCPAHRKNDWEHPTRFIYAILFAHRDDEYFQTSPFANFDGHENWANKKRICNQSVDSVGHNRQDQMLFTNLSAHSRIFNRYSFIHAGKPLTQRRLFAVASVAKRSRQLNCSMLALSSFYLLPNIQYWRGWVLYRHSPLAAQLQLLYFPFPHTHTNLLFWIMNNEYIE